MQTVKEKLLNELLTFLKKEGITKAEAARRARMDPHDLHSVFRGDRAVSLNMIQRVGTALGLEIEMNWRKKNGNVSQARRPRERSIQQTKGREEALLP